MSFLGLDPDEVGRAHHGVGGTVGAIGEMSSKITQFVRGLQQEEGRKWTGPDADKFFGRFEEFAPLTGKATERLGDRERELPDRIEAQRQASER